MRALPLTRRLSSRLPSPSEGSATDTHLSAPHASRGAYFQQLASFPNLPLPICCYQASSLLILLNFYLFFLLVVLDVPASPCICPSICFQVPEAGSCRYLLEGARAAASCFWERDRLPEAAIEECSTRRSFFLPSLSRKSMVVSLSFQITTPKT